MSDFGPASSKMKGVRDMATIYSQKLPHSTYWGLPNYLSHHGFIKSHHVSLHLKNDMLGGGMQKQNFILYSFILLKNASV